MASSSAEPWGGCQINTRRGMVLLVSISSSSSGTNASHALVKHKPLHETSFIASIANFHGHSTPQLHIFHHSGGNGALLVDDERRKGIGAAFGADPNVLTTDAGSSGLAQGSNSSPSVPLRSQTSPTSVKKVSWATSPSSDTRSSA